MKKIADWIWNERGIIAFLYAIGIVFLLPLYMKNGFAMIGDAKYTFYFWTTCIFLSLCVPIMLAGLFMKRITFGVDLTYTELFALFFGIITLVSCLLSRFSQTAIWGFTDWHMGGIIQAFLIFSLFFVGRWLRMGKAVCIFSGISSFLVCVLVIANRCGDDPLAVYGGMDWFEWNRRNLLATIGNINWVCCYLSVSVPLLIFFAWNARGNLRILGMIGAFTGVAALCLQGSDAGYVDLVFYLVILLWVSLDSHEKLQSFLDVLFLPFFFWSWFSVFHIDLITPNNVDIKGKIYSALWLIPMTFVVLLKLGLHFYYKKSGKDFFKNGKVRRATRCLIVICLLLGALLFMICQFSDSVWEFFGNRSFLRITQDWGSLRGRLWKTTLSCYGRLGITAKLFGVGPDCYVHALEELQISLASEGQWRDAVYANAHNEALTMLINEGILGLICYAGIFASFLTTMAKNMKTRPVAILGFMMIGGYVINNLSAFQQVVSTPFAFLMMACLEKWVNGDGSF